MIGEFLNIPFNGEAPTTPITSKMNSFSRNQEVPMTPILGKVLKSSPFQIVPISRNYSLGTPPQEVTPSRLINTSFQVVPLLTRNESLVTIQSILSTPCRTPVPRHPKIYDHDDQMVPSSANKSSITFNPWFAKSQRSSSNYFIICNSQDQAPTDDVIQRFSGNSQDQAPTNNVIQQFSGNSQDQAPTNNVIRQFSGNSQDLATTDNCIKQTNCNSHDQGPSNYYVQQTIHSSQDKDTILTFDNYNIGSGDGLRSVEIEVNSRDIECSTSGGRNLQDILDICAENNEATTSSQLSVRNEIDEIDETSSQQSVTNETSSTVKTKPKASTRTKRILLSSLGGCGDMLNQSRTRRNITKTQKKTVNKKAAALFDDVLLADSDEELFDRS